jgi:hypothetical protein
LPSSPPLELASRIPTDLGYPVIVTFTPLLQRRQLFKLACVSSVMLTYSTSGRWKGNEHDSPAGRPLRFMIMV